MRIELRAGLAEAPAEDTLALLAPEGSPPQDARLRPLVESGEVSTLPGRASLARLDGTRIAAAGLGRPEQADADVLRTAAAAVARRLADVGGGVVWPIDGSLALPAAEQARAAVEGLLLGGYDPGRWKTGDRRAKGLERLTLVGDPSVEPEARRALVVAERANRARDLVNAPPNELTPERLAARAREVAEETAHVRTEAFGPEGIRELGMGALAAVAQGSHEPPRLVVLRYEPPGARDDLVLGLVGKAITFDTGGVSLKPPGYMDEMKGDMAGGGAVIEGIGALAELGAPLRALGVVAATENAVGGGAYRPGDVVRAASGTTIEVVDTDAEGRLVLADALWYARREGATHLVDLATLTPIERFLGDLYAGVMGNDAGWRDRVAAAGEASGDHAWPLPLHPRFRRLVDSTFADLKNLSTLKLAVPLYAGSFLAEFAGDVPWAHVDMAGTSYLRYPRGDYLSQRGGTGYGVRLIAELARELA